MGRPIREDELTSYGPCILIFFFIFSLPALLELYYISRSHSSRVVASVSVPRAKMFNRTSSLTQPRSHNLVGSKSKKPYRRLEKDGTQSQDPSVLKSKIHTPSNRTRKRYANKNPARKKVEENIPNSPDSIVQCKSRDLCPLVGVTSPGIFFIPNIGLNNQRIGFYSLVRFALEKERNICLDSVMWCEGFETHQARRRHEELWDVDHWNSVAKESNGRLPSLLRSPPPKCRLVNLQLIRPLDLHVKQLQSHRLGIGYNDTLSLFFHALRPAKILLNSIEAFRPQLPYAALHLRVERDIIEILHYSPQPADQIFTQIFSSSHVDSCMNSHPPSFLHIATNLQLIDPEYLNQVTKFRKGKKITNHQLSLHFLNMTTLPPELATTTSEISLLKTEIAHAIIDYYICIEADSFFVGNRVASTFSSMVLLERTHQLTPAIEKAACSFSFDSNGELGVGLPDLKFNV